MRRQLTLLLGACGYNLCDRKNRARADDLLVREKAAEALAEATSALTALRTAYRRRFVPPPSREHPDVSPEHLGRLREIAATQERIAALGVRIRSAAAPAGDAVWERFRREQSLFDSLLTFDYNLIAPSQELRDRALVPEGWRDDTPAELLAMADAVERALRVRAELLEAPL